MIIESENQYHQALAQMKNILDANKGLPPDLETQSGKQLQELLAEIKIYENKYYNKDTGDEIPTYEFWAAKKGVVQGETQNPDDYEIIKLKENELTEKHINILVGEFITQFEKLPAAARRTIRQKLRY